MSNNRGTAGYTLVELLVVMLIFAVVMSIISVSFARIVQSSGQLMKSGETDVGGLIGLELMRSDLELAGLGLPWGVPGTVTYSEASDKLTLVQNCPDGCPEAKASRFDDRSYDVDSNVPRAYRVGNNVGYHGSDYLVLKGSALGTGRVSRTWGYLNYSSTVALQYPAGDDLRFKKGDRAIVIKIGIAEGLPVRELVTNGSTFNIVYGYPFPEKFLPRDKGDSYLVYGVASADSSELGFPFNRADYYITRPPPNRISSSCAPGTGVLYKSNITQGGGHTDCPILDCAADLQVVFFWDTNGDGEIDYHSGADEELLEEVVPTPAELRDKLKEIRVYILAQQGKRDPRYSYPLASADAAIIVGDAALSSTSGEVLGRVWKASALETAFGANWRNYHWKLYTIVVQPKNL